MVFCSESEHSDRYATSRQEVNRCNTWIIDCNTNAETNQDNRDVPKQAQETVKATKSWNKLEHSFTF